MTLDNGAVLENLDLTLAEYIEGLRNKMLTNKVVFDEACGLMTI